MISVRLSVVRVSVVMLALGGCAASSPPPARSVAAQAEHAEHETHGVELSAAEVVQHLRGNETELRRCFFANPSLRGAATFSWRLDVTGRVQGIRREASTLSDPRVDACLGERLGEIRFGDRDKPARARWTFVFRLVEPPKKPKHRQATAAKKRAAQEDERGLVIDPQSSGVLPAEAIDNVVEAGYPLFARCYRDGVSRNQELDGTVRLRFVVGSAGAVSEVSDGGSDLSDRQVIDCIAEGFYALRFPEPEHGSVRVLYRIGFDAS